MLSNTDGLAFTDQERRQASVLLVEPDSLLRGRFRSALVTLGYGNVSDVDDHATALLRFPERKFTHVLFSIQETKITALNFLVQILANDPSVIPIATSSKPKSDELFELIKEGARGYIVLPFTDQALDDSIVMATKGKPVPRAALQDTQRNRGLSAMVSAALDRVAALLRAGRTSKSAEKEADLAMTTFRQSARLARTFSDGGPERLLDTMQEYFIDQGKQPATKLGKLRKKLQSKRPHSNQPPE